MTRGTTLFRSPSQMMYHSILKTCSILKTDRKTKAGWSSLCDNGHTRRNQL